MRASLRRRSSRLPTRFSKRARRLGGQCRTGFRQTANGGFEPRIKAQGLTIIAGFVAHRNGEEALTQKFLLTVAHVGLVATVGKRSAHGRRNICCAIDFSQQQRASVRSHRAGRKFGHSRARVEVCKRELIMTDRFQRTFLSFCVFSCQVSTLQDVRFFFQALL